MRTQEGRGEVKKENEKRLDLWRQGPEGRADGRTDRRGETPKL